MKLLRVRLVKNTVIHRAAHVHGGIKKFEKMIYLTKKNSFSSPPIRITYRGKTMSKITNVHDKFIKEILSEKENVIDYIEEVVPKNIKENLDYSTLTIEMKNEKRK